MSAAVITGLYHCRRCGALLSHAALRSNNFLGSQSNGYVCSDCALRQLQELDIFGRELSDVYVRANKPYECPARLVLDCVGEFVEGFLVTVDGKMCEICVPCARWYFRHGGVPKESEAAWILKLR